jgi:hypothetical protein
VSERSPGGTLAQVWAVSGVAVIFADAIWRLGLRGFDAMRGGLDPLEWLALALLTAAFVYGEGVRALQRRWIPNVLARTVQLRRTTAPVYLALAPLYVIGVIGPSRASVVRAWAGVVAIVAAVVIVSRFPDPWRGIVDLAVASALLWGLIVLVYHGARTVRAGRMT